MASPIINWAVVLVVGAKLFGQASLSTVVSITKSAIFADSKMAYGFQPQTPSHAPKPAKAAPPQTQTAKRTNIPPANTNLGNRLAINPCD
jgi:hypothetical protein